MFFARPQLGLGRDGSDCLDEGYGSDCLDEGYGSDWMKDTVLIV